MVVVRDAWDVGTRDPDDRAIEVVEGFLGDDRGDLGPIAAEAVVLVDDDDLPVFLTDDRTVSSIERPERTQVDDLGADALAADQLGGFQGCSGPSGRRR